MVSKFGVIPPYIPQVSNGGEVKVHGLKFRVRVLVLTRLGFGIWGNLV